MSKFLSPLFIILALGVFNCHNSEISEPGINLIPLPAQTIPGKGYFHLDDNTVLVPGQFNSLQDRYQEEIEKEIGIFLETGNEISATNCIKLQEVSGLSHEEYHLSILKKGIEISASSPAGAYYALQTLKQLIPLHSNQSGDYLIPVLEISDKPEFEWRGYMLDVSRHFYGKAKIKEVLDFMAELKLNRFHWHLTDDQGWRIEIKKYPKLTEVGAWRIDQRVSDESINNWWGRPVQKEGEEATYGGYYTQEDIREIVAYAKERHIEILPEIDVPGHSQEILASYPELSCDQKREYYVATGGAYKDNALCASNPFTYEFLEDVLGEVMELFPLDYIHIGGDECNKSGWKKHKQCQDFIKKKGLKDEFELQSYFMRQVEKIVNAGGKKLIGWDEILEGGLAPNATVMSWRGEEGGIEAARAGHDVIMTPNYANYLDLKQGQPDFEPNLGYAEALLSTCYNYSVLPKNFTETEATKILGLQGNLWTESISDWGKLTYMSYPRLFAIAENGWTAESMQDFDDFIMRLKPQLAKLDARGVRYAKSVFNPWIYQKGNGKSIEISMDSELSSPEIRYTLDGSDPDSNSTLYSLPFILTETRTIKAAIFSHGLQEGDIIEVSYPVHLAAGAKVEYMQTFTVEDPAGEKLALTDLNYGQLATADDTNWQGFRNNFDVIIQLDNSINIQQIRIRSLRFSISGIYPPESIEIYGSTDGKDYKLIGKSGLIQESLIQGRNIIETEIDCPANSISSIRVKAKQINPIPEGHHKAGSASYLKIDELIIL